MNCCPTCGQALPETDLRVDLTHNVLLYRGQAIELTPMEAEVTYVLARHAPEVVPHPHLRARVYGAGEGVKDEQRTISVMIRRIRARIACVELSIKSIRGIGWALVFEPPKDFRYAKWETGKVERFHQLCKDGVPREIIAQELGWSVNQLKELDKYLRRNQLSRYRLPYSSGIAREVKGKIVKRRRCDA